VEARSTVLPSNNSASIRSLIALRPVFQPSN